MSTHYRTTIITMFALATIAAMFAGSVIGFGAAQENVPEDTPGGPGNGPDDTPGNGPDNGPGPHAQAPARHAERAGMFGLFDVDGSNVSGRFVSFELHNATLENYTYTKNEPVRIMDSIRIVNDTEEDAPMVRGATFQMNGTATRVIVHNNPTAMVQIIAEERTPPDADTDTNLSVIFTLANGTLEPVGNSMTTYAITGLPFRIMLHAGNNTVTIDGSTVAITLQNASQVKLMVVPHGGEGPRAYRAKYAHAVMNGRIDSELDIATANGSHLVENFAYRGRVHMEVASIQREQVRIRVESEEHAGKSVAVTLSNGTLENATLENLRVRLDGERLQHAETPDEVFNATGPQGRYYLHEENGSYHAVVYIPEFSARELTFEAGEKETSESTAPTLSMLGAVIALFVAVLALSRRRGEGK